MESQVPQMPYAYVLGELVAHLGEAAIEAGKRAAKQRQRQRAPSRGATLRPGPDTVLWNSLVDLIQPLLSEYGTKASLARVLSVPRQRVHDYFVSRIAMPDAERLLHLLGWLAIRETPDGRTDSFPKPLA